MSAALLAVLAAGAPGDGHRPTAEEQEAARCREAEARDAERALVARLRAGDEAAFRELMDAYFPRLSRFAYGIIGTRDAGDDVAQDVLARVWEMRGTLAVSTSLRAYLFRAARNRALNELGHRGVRRRAEPAIAETVAYDAERGPDVVERLSTDAVVAALQARVAALPEHRRTALRLRYEEGLTYPAIAAVLGGSVKSAEQLVALTIQTLRKELRKYR